MSSSKKRPAKNWVSRSFVFTLWEHNAEIPGLPDFASDDDVRYAIYQPECVPSPFLGSFHKFHLQGYVEFKKSVTRNRLLKILGKTAHVEPRHGSRAEAREYCMKAESSCDSPTEYGSWAAGGQGTHESLLQI